MTDRLAVVGASHAGVRLAFAAREAGFEGEIVLIGAETALPYQRPPLSKGYLKGATSLASMVLKGEKAYADARIELRLGTTVAAIDREAKTLRTTDGETIAWSKLALATGARVRRLSVPGADLAGVFHMRDLADADALAAAVPAAKRAVVIGGGFIGLEAAAVLTGLGLAVTVVEAADRLSARVFPPLLSDWLKRLHESHGVEVRLSAAVAEVLGADGRVAGVRLADGTPLDCDLVVVGIGVIPVDDLARAAGLAVDRGVLVDEHALTSDPSIAAAGDCARHPNPWAAVPGTPTLLESVQNANDQARVAASSLVGKPATYDAVPWFWSDQYDVKIQMASLPDPGDEIVVVGDPGSGHFSLLHLREGRLAAVDSVARPKDHMAARRLLLQRPRIDRDRAPTHQGDLADLCRIE